MDRERLDDWCEKGILGLVLAILLFTPLAIGAVRYPDFAIVQWMTVGILALWAVRFSINPKHRLLWIPLCWPVLAFVVYAVIRTLLADVSYLAIQELNRVLIYAAIFFAVVNNLHRQETTQILGLSLIVLAMGLSIYAVIQFLTARDEVMSIVGEFTKPDGYRKRGSATFISPNNLAGYLELILPLAIAFTITGRFSPLQKIYLGYASLVIFAGLSVTISRGGWLAGGVSLVILFFLLLRQRDYWRRALVIIVVLVGIFIFFFLKAELPPNRVERFERAHEVEDVRFRLWGPAVEMWREHPWFGVGPNHFNDRFRQYRPADGTLQARPDRAHNDYLNTFADWGLVGGLLVLACWVIFYFQVFRSWKYVQRSQNDLAAKRSNKSAFVLGGSLGLAAILVHSFFDFNMHVPAIAILVVVIMALVGAHYRFSTERHWRTVRMGLRIPIMATLILWIGFVAFHSWQTSRESVHLARARKAQTMESRLTHLTNAMAANSTNFETAYEIGEELRLKSWEGGADYQDTARMAIDWFQRAARLNPYDPNPRLRLGMCYDWLDDRPKAEVAFEEARKLDPNGYLTLAYLGWHQYHIKDYSAARKLLQQSLVLVSDPARNPIPHSYLKFIEERRGQDTE
jgi:O-antigen ligase